MDERVEKWLVDIKMSIDEVENFFKDHKKELADLKGMSDRTDILSIRSKR